MSNTYWVDNISMITKEEALLSLSIFSLRYKIKANFLLDIICDYYSLESPTSEYLLLDAIKYFILLSESEVKSIITLYILSH